MRLSASQVQTFIDCERKWSWHYVAGIEVPPKLAAVRGVKVHAELAKYLAGGEIDFTTEIGYIAASGLKHLPKPGTPGLLIEEEFHFIGPSGHSYLGYKDLEVPRIVFDHKTTSNLRWQKTPEELRTDVQATLYAVDYFRNHPDEDDVELRWVYYQTENARKSEVTRLYVNQAEVWERFIAIEQIAERMQVAADKQPLDLPPTINHCSAYGGCPHQGRCNLSPFDKMRSYMEQNKLVALLRGKQNGAAGAVVTAPAAPTVPLAFAPGGAFADLAPPAAPVANAPAVPVANAPAAANPVGNKLLARLRAGGAPVAAATVPAAAASPAATASPVAAINPPERQPPPAPPTAAVPRGPDLVLAATILSQRAAMAEAGGRELAESLAQDEIAPVNEPRGRGRPPKAALPPTGLVVKIKTLYLNCAPVGVPIVDAAHFIVLAKQRIAAAGIADYRFVEYGQGPGMLAVAVVAELDALEGVIAAVRLDTSTPEGAIIAVEFTARAGLVVR